MTPKYYVYMYRDPRQGKDFQPIYVGQGLAGSRRAYFHWEHPKRCNKIFRNVLAAIASANLLPLIEILFTTDERSEVITAEIALIAQYGRRDLGTGSLCNCTSGGDGAVGHPWSPEQRQKIMAKLMQDTQREASRQRLLDRWQKPGYRTAHLNRVKANLSMPGYRAKLRAAIIASRTEDVRQAIGEGARRNWENPYYREKVLAAQAEGNAAPEAKARRGESTRRGWANAETRRKRTAGIGAAKRTPEAKAEVARKSREYYADEARRAEAGAFASAYNTPEVRAAKAAALKARWADPVWRAQREFDKKELQELKLIRSALHARRAGLTTRVNA